MPRGKPRERVKSKVVLRNSNFLQNQSEENRVRRIKTTHGNTIIVMPGVSPHLVAALFPSNWSHQSYFTLSGRMKKGQGVVFSAKTVDSKKRQFSIQVRSIRPHYSTTHEARMILKLKEHNFGVEDVLGIVDMNGGQRLLVTRREENPVNGPFKEVKHAEKRLKKLGILPEDLYEYGKQNFLFVEGPNGKPRLILIDVEHYHSLDPNSKLHSSRMLRKKPQPS